MATHWISGAKKYLAYGFSPVPIPKLWKPGESKDYWFEWKQFQEVAMTEAQVERHFVAVKGIGVVCGAVSGNLIVIDFDSFPAFELWAEEVKAVDQKLFDQLVIEKTQNGGRHVWLRLEQKPRGNEKWAMREKKAAIETRGEGGLIFCAPTPGYEVIQGSFKAIPVVTEAEFSILEALARTQDEREDVEPPKARAKSEQTGERPGDVYNRTKTWDDLFSMMGAKVEARTQKRILLCRPGKRKGVSGTTGNGFSNQDLFVCHSSNWPPFEMGKSYSKFAVLAICDCGGDYAKAAVAAAKELGLERTVKTSEKPLRVEAGGVDKIDGALALRTAEGEKPADWHPSDIGNAEQFALAAVGKLMYCHELKRWVQWTGKRWDLASIGNAAAVSLYRELILPLKDSDPGWWIKCMSAARMRATIASAADFIDLSCNPGDFDNDPMILNTQDGIVHLGTGDLIPHDPKYMCSKITTCGVKHSEADQALVSRFIAEICDDNDESIESLQRLLGYSVTGHIEQQKFVLAVGRGRNGKGTLTNSLQKLLGDYATSLESDMILSSKQPRSPFDLEQLRGARFVKAEEPDARRMLDREFIKKLVGGDSFRVAAKFGTPYIIWPQCKLWLISNHKPRVEFDFAFERRAIVFPFTMNLSEEDVDPNLEKKIIAAGGALLSWIVAGSVGYHEAESNKLPTTERMRQELASYKEDNDNLQRFLDEMTEVDTNQMAVGYTESTKFVHAFNDWAKGAGTSQMNHQELVQRMKVKGYETAKVGHQKLKGYRGIVLISEERSS